jgi:hypothetical protein
VPLTCATDPSHIDAAMQKAAMCQGLRFPSWGFGNNLKALQDSKVLGVKCRVKGEG